MHCCLWSVCLFRLYSVEQYLLITVTKFALQFRAVPCTLLLPMLSVLNSDHGLLQFPSHYTLSAELLPYFIVNPGHNLDASGEEKFI